MTIADLPALNAGLNATSSALLTAGFFFIRRGEIERHRICMIAAFVVSSAFLISYVVYHANHGSTPFPGTGASRFFYFALLVSHVVLAALVVPFALSALYRGLRREDARHRRVARIAFPIWIYVSVTGVVVYWILYQLFRPFGPG